MTAHEFVPKDAPVGWWWACERPEAPPEHDLTVFDTDGCPKCRLAIEALVHQGDDGLLLDDKDGKFYELAESLR